MKTPIQELFEFMEQNQYFIGNDLFDKYQELLDKEKEVITDAYVVGEREWLMKYEGCRDAYTKRASYKYYDETFNIKE